MESEILFDEKKIEQFRNLKGLKQQKEALNQYFTKEFAVTCPMNYSFDRMLEEAKKRILEKEKSEEQIIQEMREKSTIISPFQILQGDTSIIRYDEDARRTAMFEKEQKKRQSLFNKARYKCGVVDKFEEEEVLLEAYETESGDMNEEYIESRVGYGSHIFDIELPKFFKPVFKLNLKSPEGEPCASIDTRVYDEIFKNGSSWKLNAHKSFFRTHLLSLVYYIQNSDKKQVVIREPVNSTYIILR